MTWLLVLIAWTACATVVAPVIGRVLAHSGRVAASARPARSLPSPRSPLLLR